MQNYPKTFKGLKGWQLNIIRWLGFFSLPFILLGFLQSCDKSAALKIIRTGNPKMIAEGFIRSYNCAFTHPYKYYIDPAIKRKTAQYNKIYYWGKDNASRISVHMKSKNYGGKPFLVTAEEMSKIEISEIKEINCESNNAGYRICGTFLPDKSRANTTYDFGNTRYPFQTAVYLVKSKDRWYVNDIGN